MQICLAHEILVSNNSSLLSTCPLSKVFYAGKGEVKSCLKCWVLIAFSLK